MCGRLPHPRRVRLAVAKLTAILPVEFTLHALVLHHHLPTAVAVSVLAVTTTVLVIWLIEPSAMRLLAPWMHAPALRSRDRHQEPFTPAEIARAHRLHELARIATRA
ncbi:hypothetical protein C5E44_00050 [Nocardia nova]|nr:hypothetical protein C5E44_00050 [Nocardia nova]